MAKIGYARVSTAEQSANLQVDALKAAGFEEIHVEVASGARDDRPILRRVLTKLKTGDVLGVWRLDRLGRSLSHLIGVISGLKDRRIGFRSLNGDIDTTTPNGLLIFHIFGALGEFERNIIRERTIAGLAAARARGRIGGNPALKRKDPQAIRRLRSIRRDVHTKRLLEHVDGWLPTVRRMRPVEPWEAVAEAINALPGPPGGRWTPARLLRAVRHLASGGLVDKGLLARAPKTAGNARTPAMIRADELLRKNPKASLSELARELQSAGELTPRKSVRWSPTSVKTLLRTGRAGRHIRKPAEFPDGSIGT